MLRSKKYLFLNLLKSTIRVFSFFILFSVGDGMDDLHGDFIQLAAFGLAVAEGVGILGSFDRTFNS